MNNEYKINTLADLLELDERQIKAFCNELPEALIQIKAVIGLLEVAGDVMGVEKVVDQITPLTWKDDGKKDLTVGFTAGEEKLGSIAWEREGK